MKLLLPVIAVASLGWVRGEPPLNVTLQADRDLLPTAASDCVLQIQVVADKKASEKRKTPLNLAVVLDRSGSMSGAKIEKARQAACVALDQLEEGDIFSLVVYDNEVEVVIPTGKVKDKKALEQKINDIQARGSTALYAGMKEGARQLKEYLGKERINRVILLSDGLANVGPQSPAELAALGQQLSRDGMAVSTIGLGEDYNEDLMTALAEASHGNYYYVQDAEKLPGIFQDELGSVKSIVARNVKLILTLPEGIAAKGVLGEEKLKFEGNRLEIPLGEVSSGQKRSFLLGLKVPAGQESDLRLADLKIVYDDEKQQARELTAQAQVSRTEDAEASSQSINAEVIASAAIVDNRLAKEKAVALADAGRAKEAAEVLRGQAAINAALPAPARSDVITQDQDALLLRASELDSRGALSKQSRKRIQYENYQDKTQKR